MKKEDNIDKSIGIKIKDMRLGLGLSQEKLANKAGICIQSIRNYESGKAKLFPNRFISICKALGCHPSELLKEFEESQF